MTKNINGDVYSDLITSADSRAMASGSIPRKTIDRIVIHHNATTNKDVAINTWLASGSAQTSAHYEVANNEIIGIVGEGTTAWHAGNGDMNARSIGIENLNSAGEPNWPVSSQTFESLSKLVADIAKRYGFPIDSTHVIPHNAVVGTRCPGGIDVAKVIARAREIAGGNGGSNTNTGNNTNGLDQVLHVGEYFKARKSYRVDAMKFVNGVWQVVNYELAGGKDFSWVYNGFGVASTDKVDTNGNITKDQELSVGAYFRLHSDRIKVVDANDSGVALDTRYGRVWVDASTLTEVK
ncbi:phage-related amidase [Leuconostoc phage Ln-8]|uniref:N-acetylmuramoyl-L-alanine amidase n=2 Tax=Unaquatrovirus TaxID=2169622 RepID=A0A0D3MKG1_9CAUD|nr:endolysin [Leuconostoc phage Ln-8]YP_010080410.1 endolysin [Leuconostoc phage Ln-7]AIM50935.1 phage-related amidase [Leuconostoc phage Ln-8]AOT27907.1 amidase [Leuconostoc phage Ln-7]